MRKLKFLFEDYKKWICYKCKKLGYYIADCFCWGKELKKKKYKDDNSDDLKKKKKFLKFLFLKFLSYKKISFRKVRVFIGKEMDFEVEFKECDEEEGSDEDLKFVQVSFVFVITFVNKLVFNFEENDNIIYTDDYVYDFVLIYCFMVKG